MNRPARHLSGLRSTSTPDLKRVAGHKNKISIFHKYLQKVLFLYFMYTSITEFASTVIELLSLEMNLIRMAKDEKDPAFSKA